MISRLGSIGSAGGGTVQLSSGEYFMNSYQFMNQLPNAPFSKSRISYFRAWPGDANRHVHFWYNERPFRTDAPGFAMLLRKICIAVGYRSRTRHFSPLFLSFSSSTTSVPHDRASTRRLPSRRADWTDYLVNSFVLPLSFFSSKNYDKIAMQLRYCKRFSSVWRSFRDRRRVFKRATVEDGGEGWFVDLVKPILFRESPTQKSVHLSRVKIHDARSLAADL